MTAHAKTLTLRLDAEKAEAVNRLVSMVGPNSAAGALVYAAQRWPRVMSRLNEAQAEAERLRAQLDDARGALRALVQSQADYRAALTHAEAVLDID